MRAEFDNETWQNISHETECRSKLNRFKGLSEDVINQIILTRASVYVKNTYQKKFSVYFVHDDHGYVRCSIAPCKNKPTAVVVWCPAKEALEEKGHRAFQVLLCGKHAIEGQRDFKIIDDLVEQVAKPYWKETH